MLMHCICLEGKSHSQSFVKKKKRIMFLFDFFSMHIPTEACIWKGHAEIIFYS